MQIEYNLYRKNIVLISSCFLFINCSIKNKEKQSIVDETLILHEKVEKNNTDSTLYYITKANKTLALLEPPIDSLLIDNHYLKGKYYLQVKNPDSAAYYFHKAINLIDEKNIQPKHLKYFRNAWDNDLKIEHYSNGNSIANKYINICAHKKETQTLEHAYFFLGELNYELNNKEKELAYYKKALQAAKVSENKSMSNLISLAIVENIFSSDRAKAFRFLDSLSKEQNSALENRNLYHKYGILRFYNNEFEEAIKNYKKAVHYSKKNSKSKQFDYNMTYGYANIAEAYIELNDIEHAEKYLDSAAYHLNENSESNEFSFVGQQKISLNYLKGGSIQDTRDFFNEMVSIQNKAYTNKIEEEVFALKSSNAKQKLLSKQKQDTEINNLKLKSRNIVLSISAIAISLFGYFLFRYRKHKFKRQSLQMQQRLLRSQMNPHFISNTLYAIQNTIKNDQERSVNYLTKFSRLLRLILENSMQNYVLLEKELESLKKYMDLQLLRFPDKFTYTITTQEIEDDLVSIPPMLLQPFVENSIEHGFSGIDYKGEIKITLSKTIKHLSCVIEDNGVGLLENNNPDKQSASFQLISDFIFKTTKTKISVIDKKTIQNLDSGTRIEFLIPYKILEHD